MAVLDAPAQQDLRGRSADRAGDRADIRLVAVDARGVDVAIAELERGGDPVARGRALRGLPDAEADLGDLRAGGERDARRGD